MESEPAHNDLVVNFPAAGSYPFELHYSNCCDGTLTLTVFANGAPNSAGGRANRGNHLDRASAAQCADRVAGSRHQADGQFSCSCCCHEPEPERQRHALSAVCRCSRRAARSRRVGVVLYRSSQAALENRAGHPCPASGCSSSPNREIERQSSCRDRHWPRSVKWGLMSTILSLPPSCEDQQRRWRLRDRRPAQHERYPRQRSQRVTRQKLANNDLITVGDTIITFSLAPS